MKRTCPPWNLRSAPASPGSSSGFWMNGSPPRWLISSGGRIEYLPHRIVCSCHMDPAAGKEFLEILLARNWRINDAPPNGVTALQCALYHSNLHGDLLKYLLQKGADPHQKNKRGFSAFQAVKNPVHLSILNQYK